MLRKLIWEIWINGIGSSRILPGKFRYLIYRIGGLKTESPRIRSGCKFNGHNVHIKKGAFLNQNVFINCRTAPVVIGENTSIAFGSMILTSTHEIGISRQRAGKSKGLPVEIGPGCWIGARATILPGVKIGEGCIIAAGAVVNKDCEPNGLYAGVPARRIKDLPIDKR